jgi:inositol 1,4,5-triphosphate receptor type 1/inositol 1,4,5-triphosphate receptor type 3
LARESDRFVVDQQAARKKAQVVEGEERREGYSIFKLQVVELLRLIHIQAERGSVQNSELFGSFIAVSALFDFELKRLDKLNDIEQVQPGFIEYYMQGLIPFAICYYNRFLKSIRSLLIPRIPGEPARRRRRPQGLLHNRKIRKGILPQVH